MITEGGRRLEFAAAPSTRRYRADIDGLRALAIIPVVLYHYGIPGFAGGFVGVDVFFVISGYLIAGILGAEIREGRFSLAGFYERRVRRIFPALAVVALSTFAATLFLLPPDKMQELGSEFIWSSFFATNIWFFKKSSDYFAGVATLKPLLHLWSLAIEEQFYVLFPLLLRLTRRCGLRDLGVVSVLSALCLISLAVSVHASIFSHLAGFFLLPSRAWELLGGALLALSPRPRLSAIQSGLMASAGMVAITAAIVLFNDRTPFPGAAALLPCLGAVALIWGGEGWAEGRAKPIATALLARKEAVWVGRISYPLYLWHWPLLVLARFEHLGEPLLSVRLSLMVLSVALAAATAALIEGPVRSRRVLARRRPLLAAGLAVLAALLAVGQVARSTHGLPGRLPLAEAQREIALRHRAGLVPSVFCTGPATRFHGGWKCRLGSWDGEGNADFVVWGDSHAGHLSPVLDAIAHARGLRGMLFWSPACPPLIDAAASVARREGACGEFNRAVVADLNRSPAPLALLAARWPNVAAMNFPAVFGADRAPWLCEDNRCSGISVDDGHQAFSAGLGNVLALLGRMGSRVALIQDAPQQPFNVDDAVAVDALLRRPFIMGFSADRRETVRRQQWVDDLFRQAAADGRAVYIRTLDLFCDADSCPAARNGQPLYGDDSHLSAAGAMLLRPALEPLFGADRK